MDNKIEDCMKTEPIFFELLSKDGDSEIFDFNCSYISHLGDLYDIVNNKRNDQNELYNLAKKVIDAYENGCSFEVKPKTAKKVKRSWIVYLKKHVDLDKEQEKEIEGFCDVYAFSKDKKKLAEFVHSAK